MTDLSQLFEALISNLRTSECLREKIVKQGLRTELAFEYSDFDGDG
jgi:hypothetical protein